MVGQVINLSYLICFIFLLFLTAPAQPKQSSPQTVEVQLKAALQREPNSAIALHQLGEFYLRQNKFQRAIPLLAQAAQIDPTHYVNGYDLALAYLRSNQLDAARTQVRVMLERQPTAELYGLLGDVEQQAGRDEVAAEEYQRAARLDESEDRLLAFAASLVKIRAYEGSLQIFNYGLKKYTQSAKLRVALGVAHYSAGHYDKAVTVLCEAADLDPTDARSFQFLGEMYGVVPEMAEQVTQRMKEFVTRHPQNALAHFYYAMSLWKGRRDTTASTADVKEIEALLRAALRLEPKLAAAHLELGLLLADQQNTAAAIRSLLQAVRLNPALPKAHYRLMQLYQRTGQKAQAAQSLAAFQKYKEKEAPPVISK
ncbi:MAG: tetratricopeptide repeat protein [Blastocatellia bacterium]